MTTNLIDSIETEKPPATRGVDYAAPARVIVRDLVKRYGDLTAVAGVSFEVRRGEVFGLLGPNGAGKTTTVEIIEGLRPRDGGEVTVCGFDPAEDAGEVKKRIGVALQATALPDKIEVREALSLFAGFYQANREDRADVDRLLRTVSLEEKAKSRFDTLSGGQRLCNLLFFPLMFLGGAAFPMEFLPPKLQDLARVLPSNYMVDGLYRVMKEGEGLAANLKNLTVLLLCCAVSLFVAAKLFRWEADEKLPLKRKAWAAAVVAIFVGAALFVKR